MLSRLFIMLLWQISVGYAINCYQGVVYNGTTTAPKDQLSCPIATYCTKITALIPVTVTSYGCDQSASLCRMIDCHDNQNGGKTCCCATDYCNLSSTNFGLFTVIAPLLLFMLI